MVRSGKASDIKHFSVVEHRAMQSNRGGYRASKEV